MEYPESSTLRDLLRVGAQGLLPALVLGVSLAFGVFYLADGRPERFEATATLLVANSANPAHSFDVTLVTAPRIDVAAYEAAARSSPVLSSALRRLGGDFASKADREALQEDLTIAVLDMRESSLINLTIRGVSPQQAAARANAIAQALLDWDQQRAVRTLVTITETLEVQIAGLNLQVAALADSGQQFQIDALSARRASLSTQLSSAQALMTSAIGRLEILEPAQIPTDPIAANARLLGAAAFILAVFLVYASLTIRSAIDTRVLTMDAFSRATGVPVITDFVMPRKGCLRIDTETAGFLRAHVLHGVGESEAGPRVIVVTSPIRDDARPMVSVGLAESLARSGLRTLLIDADMRRPSIGSTYRLSGLANVIDLETYLSEPDRKLTPRRVFANAGTDVSLHVITSSGTAVSPSELLGSAFVARLDELTPHFDVIVIDTPPVLEVADALSIAPYSDGVLIVANLRRLTRMRARQSIEALNRIGATVLGATVSEAADEV